MNAIQFIRFSLDTSAQWTLALIDDMKDQPLTFPTPKGGSHPLWVLGHLAYAEGSLQGMISGKANPLAHWEPVFGAGTDPSGRAEDYPSFEEARAAFVARRAETLRILETLTDADLERAADCPAELRDILGTVGKCLNIILFHVTSHRGQVADARRAAGRKPLMM